MNGQQIQDKLIRLFATHSISELEDGENGTKIFCKDFEKSSYKEVENIKDYNTVYTRVRQAKKTLEEIMEKNGGAKAQIKRILESIESSAVKRKEALCQLVKQSCYNKWAEDEKHEFDKKYEIMTTWKDYFISYTTRNAYHINQMFHPLIAKFVPVDRRSEQWCRQNYLARVVADCIKRHNLSGFFDKTEMQCGDIICDEIRGCCRNAFSFIQLIELISFNPLQEGENWSYLEYSEFMQRELPTASACISSDQGLFFLIVGESIEEVKPANMPADYQEWYNDCARRLHVSLGALLPMNSTRASRELVRQMGRIATTIKDIRKRIVDELLK